jgi:hypothetical protein
MSQRVVTALVLIAVIAVVGYWYLSSDERRIKKALSEAKEAIENEDLDAAMSHVSLQYRDERGWAYLIVKRVLERSFNEFDGIEIRMDVQTIEIREKEAEARVGLTVLADLQGQKAFLLGNDAEPARAQITLIKETLGWRITAVNGLRPAALEF